ncbi:cytochrome oxidase assembly protein-domain-containing protein [Microdochium trichocladiopsis]|uniref:Cytochrome oxidase assembly protein-domain-containing protein n=1 Tax=Microdochium trichocladiopsis TaxID=1682393 RepID=A0A9P8XV25_9PEZI|nr:cytochrome oxidase assembly protein-domain-containing protein [Microdochium trichocladiopsis]KAH7020986.1 cytochrome oxidase assembly protein-domain-containing protein [Microdochium trichocladiopsis]
MAFGLVPAFRRAAGASSTTGTTSKAATTAAVLLRRPLVASTTATTPFADTAATTVTATSSAGSNGSTTLLQSKTIPFPTPTATTPIAVDNSVEGAASAESQSGSSSSSSRSSSFPDMSSRSVGLWLVGSAVSVFGIVIFGGLTRLTESGLSITEWKPVTGSLPPMSQADWEDEFTKYKASPEFKMLNSHMNLAEFKQIYFMEWTHRLWGRFIGMSFVLPAVYFVARRRVTKRMAWTLLGISGLIGFQGFIGWWMVKSGLKDDLFAPGSHPRVSQYRLTAHLATAFVCYSWMLLAGLGVLRTRRLVTKLEPAAAMAHLAALRNPALLPYRRLVTLLTGLIFTTVLSGALVAGLDAGLIYNEFPYMGLGLTPPRKELFDDFYSHTPDRSDLVWRNMLENPSLVQLDHRILATTTFFSVLALFAYSRRGQAGKLAAAIPPDVRKATLGLVHLVSLQVALGISTLIYMVPVPLAAAHQAGALALLTGVLILGQRLRVPRSTLRLVQKRLDQVAGGKLPPRL